MSLTNRFDDQRAELAVLEAKELEFTEGPDAALKMLGPPTDPVRMRAVLGILIRAERYQQAADILSNQAVHDKWIDLGAAVFAILGDTDRALRLVERADESPDQTVMRRTRVAFAEGVFERWHKPGESSLAVRDWETTDVSMAHTVINTLDPVLSLVRANRQIHGDLQLSAVEIAVRCSHIANEQSLLKQFSAWLVRFVPVPLLVAELCLRGLIECPENLTGRLRVEHPGDFQANFLAALIERELLNKPDEAFDALIQLGGTVGSDDEKESVCNGIFETCGRVASRIDQAIDLIQQLMPNNTRLVGLLRVFRHIDENELPKAREALDSLGDVKDGVWWQARAHLCEKLGDEDDAQAAWEKASELLPHADVIRRAVQASIDRRRFQSAARGLEKLLRESPNGEQELRMMSWILVQLGDNAHAVDYLRRLVEIAPDNPEYSVGLAQCLSRCARVHEAIGVLEPLCNSDDAPYEAIIVQSHLLEVDGRAPDGFRLLQKVAPDHWDEPVFLLSYMHQAHAAGEDRPAHEAFTRLLELRHEGSVPPELMQEKTFEQLLEYGEQFRRRRESLQKEIISGRLPWLLAEDILGNPSKWAWLLHTQRLKWISEERLSRASHTIYMTNGFTVRILGNSRRLEPITGLISSSEVVVDLSALLTLHRLDRIAEAADFYGGLVLPASYGELRLRDSGRFGQHQPSRRLNLERIRSEISLGKVKTVKGDCSTLISLDEYSDAVDVPHFRLRDLIEPLQKLQKSNPQQLEELRSVAHRAPTEGIAILRGGENLLFDLTTLRTLAGQPAFDAVLDVFNVHLHSDQQAELLAELEAHNHAASAKEAHDVMWATVSNLHKSGKIRWASIPGNEEQSIGLDEADELRSVHFDAMTIARHDDLPLIADDRVLQAAMLSEDKADPSRAFGTDAFLLALVAKNERKFHEIADNYRSLIQWRYRFLVPPPELLTLWAKHYLDDPPGNALLDVAAYMHDCLRDPGLFCGPEQTDPPMPMAAKLVTAWIDTLTSFLAEVWSDDEIPQEKANALTLWASEELTPSCPRGLWGATVGQNIARLGADALLQMAIAKFIAIEDAERANYGLRCLADGLGIDSNGFVTAAVEAIHAIE